MSTSGNPEDRTVEAGRRRPTGPSGRVESGRAETPQRQGYSGGGGGGGGPAGPSGGGGLPFGKGCLSIAGIVLVVIIGIVVFGLQYCGGGSALAPGGPTDTSTGPGLSAGQISNQAAAQPFITKYANLTQTPPAKAGQTWLVMMYEDADDKILEQDIDVDVNEAEKAGPSNRVKIVVQMDRLGAWNGDNNWKNGKRFLISQDNDLDHIHSQQVADLGPVNMSDGKTLVDFVTWAIQTYPSDKYALILSDHGMGWPGGWTDASEKGSVNQSIPLESRLGDALFLNELDDALGQIRTATKLDKFELIGLDACLMSQVEVLTSLEPHARYAVTSEETEPSLGYAYTATLQALNQNPDMSGADLGKAIVQGYLEGDQRIVDPTARAEFLGRGSPLGGLFGQPQDVAPEQLAQEIGQNSTLAAIDLSRIPALNSSLNNLAYSFQKASPKALASASSYAQKFTNVFSNQEPASYIDLSNFLQIFKQQNSDATINQAADAVITVINQAVIAEKHGAGTPGANGIAIYYPNSDLYKSPISGAASYTAIASRFARQSLWDDFLAFNYGGVTFNQNSTQAAVPPASSIKAPASGGISVSAVTASSPNAAPGQPVTLSASINGNNVGYIYLFVGFYDQQSNSIFVADQDYLDSAQNRQINGVYYPDWGQGPFTLKFGWDPIVFNLSDGTTDATALFKPRDFGRSREEAVYTVDGTYTYASGGNQLKARLFFVNGILRQVFGFNGQFDVGAPREITPSAGDKFTIQETWYQLDSSGKVANTVYQDGKTFTFGSQMFTWKVFDAAAGSYQVGFIVSDLDGNQQQTLTQITVR